ncbi:MAG: hypothetical protein WC520_01095 [Candidatus Paceibacterota bacterium]
MKYTQDIPWYKNDYLSQEWTKEESAHYFFYFQKNSLAEKDIKVIVDSKEKQYSKIITWLEVDNNKKIDYYLYPSIREKNIVMGDDSPGNAIWQELDNIGGQFMSKKFEIHIVYSEKCKFIGEHEDTHLLSLPWGLSIYLFCEGLAQYMENNFMGIDLHISAKRLLNENKLYPIEWLCDNNNWETVQPTIIYPQVGSFVKFIIENYGKEKFKEVYQKTSRNINFSENLTAIEKVYSKTIDQLGDEWINYIKNIGNES